MTDTHDESRRLEAWTSPAADGGVRGPERDAWLAFGQAIDASIPSGDNDLLLKRIRKQLETDAIPPHPPRRAWQALEPIAASLAIAALVVFAVIVSTRNTEGRRPDRTPVAPATSAQVWNDELAAQVEFMENATSQLTVDLSRPESLDREFLVVEHAIANLAEDLDQSRW